MKKLFLALACAVSLTGCTALPGLATVGSGISANSDKVVLEGTKALTVASDAYTTAASIAAAAVNSGFGTPDQLRMIRTLNNQAIALLNGSDTALTAAQRAAGLSLIVTQLHSIIGR